MESAGHLRFGDCGDYSTTVINCNHLTAIDPKIRAISDV